MRNLKNCMESWGTNKVCDACPQRMCSYRNALIDKCWFEKDSEQISEFIKDKISKTMDFTAEQLRESVQKLYSDIDKCISDLINARLEHDEYAEGKALFTMEHLMVATQQELACVNDFLCELLQEKNGR